MTLILVLANSDATIMVADRRLSLDGIPTTEESNKLAVLVCDNARLAMGYTGLADDGAGLRTADWLLESALEAIPEKCQLGSLVEHLRHAATERWEAIALPPERKRLTVGLAGYTYHHSPPRGVLACITNFEDAGTGLRSATAAPEFRTQVWEEVRPSPEPYYMAQAFGAVGTLKRHPSDPFKELLQRSAPRAAIRDKAWAVIDDVAAKEGMVGPVGGQCGSVIVPRDLSEIAVIDYHSAKNAWSVEFPSVVTVTSDGRGGAIRGMGLRAEDPSSAPPLVTGRVGRNQPCPCGSGKKFKWCHGRAMPGSPGRR